LNDKKIKSHNVEDQQLLTATEFLKETELMQNFNHKKTFLNTPVGQLNVSQLCLTSATSTNSRFNAQNLCSSASSTLNINNSEPSSEAKLVNFFSPNGLVNNSNSQATTMSTNMAVSPTDSQKSSSSYEKILLKQSTPLKQNQLDAINKHNKTSKKFNFLKFQSIRSIKVRNINFANRIPLNGSLIFILISFFLKNKSLKHKLTASNGQTGKETTSHSFISLSMLFANTGLIDKQDTICQICQKSMVKQKAIQCKCKRFFLSKKARF
jgi:hypothetical protein